MYQTDDDTVICHLFQKYGIRLSLKRYKDKKKDSYISYYLYMVINPRKLLDMDAPYLGILPPKKRSIKAIKATFQELFADSPIHPNLDAYTLRRVDLCTNFYCSNTQIFEETMRVLHKLPVPKRYKRVEYKNQEDRKDKKGGKINKRYLQYHCGTHDLVMYDKTYQVGKEGLVDKGAVLPKGILRFEVQYQRKLIRDIEKDYE